VIEYSFSMAVTLVLAAGVATAGELGAPVLAGGEIGAPLSVGVGFAPPQAARTSTAQASAASTPMVLRRDGPIARPRSLPLTAGLAAYPQLKVLRLLNESTAVRHGWFKLTAWRLGSPAASCATVR